VGICPYIQGAIDQAKGATAVSRNILITGATGKTGKHTCATLLERGHRVRALVHRADERSAQLANAGADVIVGDLLSVESLTEATAGVDGIYLTYPIAPGLIEATANLLQTAEENGVGSIVNMSQKSARRDATSNSARQHWVAERLLDRYPGSVTHLRPTFFAEWLMVFWNKETGELRLPFEDCRHAPIAAEDQARVIAAILENPEEHAGKIYPLYGPEELDHHQIADRMSRTLDMKVDYVPIGLAEFRTILERRGSPEHLIQHLVSVAVDYREGVFAGTNDIVHRLTGRDPLSVEEFIERNRLHYRSD
jgi:uncharacterized protein YbjT (DUF2867 family)